MTPPRRRRLLLLSSLALLTVTASAQTITVRLLNGKSGKPFPNRNVTFHWGDTQQATVVPVDKNGIGHVTVPAGFSEFILAEGPLSEKQPHSIAFEDCNSNANTPVSVAQVMTHGVTPGNTCSERKAAAHPGEVVFWGRTRSWLADTIQ